MTQGQMASDEKLVAEILALDLVTLRAHTEAAGDKLEAEAHRSAIAQSLIASEGLLVRRGDVLVAYALLRPQTEGRWFVGAFGTHLSHRNASTIRELLSQLMEMVERRSIKALRSNVYKTNRMSMAFHRRLGFRITRENDKGVQFDATLESLKGNASLMRMSSRVRRILSSSSPQPTA